jgi:hypothetical protein
LFPSYYVFLQHICIHYHRYVLKGEEPWNSM